MFINRFNLKYFINSFNSNVLLIAFWMEKLRLTAETQHWNLACLTLGGPNPCRVKGRGWRMGGPGDPHPDFVPVCCMTSSLWCPKHITPFLPFEHPCRGQTLFSSATRRPQGDRMWVLLCPFKDKQARRNDSPVSMESRQREGSGGGVTCTDAHVSLISPSSAPDPPVAPHCPLI